MRFLGVDLAWTEANPSGVVALEGDRFPLRLVEGPATLPTHAAVLDWLVDGLRHPGRGTATAVGIDAPLLGLGAGRGRPCDDEIARRFGRKTIVDWRKVDRLVASGHLARDGQRIAVTAQGRLLLDHLLAEIAPIATSAVPLPQSPLPEPATRPPEQLLVNSTVQ